MDHTFRTAGWAQHRRFGIGSLRDVGIYPLALLTSFFGHAVSVTAASVRSTPAQRTQVVKEEEEQEEQEEQCEEVVNVDGWMLRVKFANGVLANITSSMSMSAPSGIRRTG